MFFSCGGRDESPKVPYPGCRAGAEEFPSPIVPSFFLCPHTVQYPLWNCVVHENCGAWATKVLPSNDQCLNFKWIKRNLTMWSYLVAIKWGALFSDCPSYIYTFFFDREQVEYNRCTEGVCLHWYCRLISYSSGANSEESPSTAEMHLLHTERRYRLVSPVLATPWLMNKQVKMAISCKR